ncbi:hypothetical protein HYV43_01960 [Candidatus Micrarchaeota archaeon]|nr:hypothetical protein [Candidatus Micrarchaeota archaeon]
MIERCAYRHFDDLTAHQQKQMIAVLNRKEGASEVHMDFMLTDGRPVALLKDDRIIAAIVLDKDHNILHFNGRNDREFLKEIGHTPAEAILRAYVEHRNDRKLTFVGEPSDGAINMFNNRFTEETNGKRFLKGVRFGRPAGDVKTIHISKYRFKKFKSAIPFKPDVWRMIQYPNLLRAGFRTSESSPAWRRSTLMESLRQQKRA